MQALSTIPSHDESSQHTPGFCHIQPHALPGRASAPTKRTKRPRRIVRFSGHESMEKPPRHSVLHIMFLLRARHLTAAPCNTHDSWYVTTRILRRTRPLFLRRTQNTKQRKYCRLRLQRRVATTEKERPHDLPRFRHCSNDNLYIILLLLFRNLAMGLNEDFFLFFERNVRRVPGHVKRT